MPDAGSIMRVQQPGQGLTEELPVAGSGDGDFAPESGGVRVSVNGFIFSGYEGIAGEAELQELVAGAVGRRQSFSELKALASKVTDHLRKKGWFLARAYLPKQEVTSGMVRIAILQGNSDAEVRIGRDPGVRICESRLLRIGKLGVRPGEPLDERALERSVLLMNDLPGVSARAALSSGREPGSSMVDFMVSEGALVSGVVWGDNQGNRYTGVWRGNAMVSLNDPGRYGDQLKVMATVASGLEQGRIDYTVPLRDDGLRGSLGLSVMHYRLGEEIAVLKYAGWGRTMSAGLSYPLLRSRKANVSSTLTAFYKELVDSQSGTDLRNRHIPSLQLGFSGSWFDTWLSHGYTIWSVTAVAGSLHESIADIHLPGTEGGYSRFNIEVSRLERLADRLTLHGALSAQYAPVNLDSSEKFYLGGPEGVRAYPIGEAGGDMGQLCHADLSYSVPTPAGWGNLQLICFYDAGHITLNSDRYVGDVMTATFRNEYWLQGTGAGLNYTFGRRFSVRGNWAHVIGQNPGRSFFGKNADGRSDRSRFWLQAALFF